MLDRRKLLAGLGVGSLLAVGDPRSATAAPSAPPSPVPLALSATGDNTSRLNAAIRDVRSSTGGTVVMPKGRFAIRGRVHLLAGVSLVGQGNSGTLGYAGTELMCETADSGLVVTGGGGGVRDVKINALGVATRPFVVDGAVDRTFSNLDVHNSARDAIQVNGAQNCVFMAITANSSARDGILLDLSAGGNIFIKVNVNRPGRHSLAVRQSNPATGGAYPNPTHNRFEHCVFERPRRDVPMVSIRSATAMTLASCMLSPSSLSPAASAPVVEVVEGRAILFEGCYWAGIHAKRQRALAIRGGGSLVVIASGNVVNNMTQFADVSGGLLIRDGRLISNGVAFATLRSRRRILK